MTARVGLIINPLAGAGGPLAQHGSDAFVATGELPVWANKRAVQALHVLQGLYVPQWVCGAGVLGENVLLQLGCQPQVLGYPRWPSTAEHTRALAAQMLEEGIDLLLFVGGDGTARDIFSAVGQQCPVLGIPAGVKMQSACFGVSPAATGRLAAAFLASEGRTCESREVMDLDEQALGQGQISPSLFGYLQTPVNRHLLQGRKSRSEPDDSKAAMALALSVMPQLVYGVHLIGPGSTTWALKQALGVNGSLIGIDVVADGRLWLRDASEPALWDLVDMVQQQNPKLWLTAIGGQGHVIGRGNAPLSPRVLHALGRDALTILVTNRKLRALADVGLRVDSGSSAVDALFAGMVRVRTAPREQTMLRLVGS